MDSLALQVNPAVAAVATRPVATTDCALITGAASGIGRAFAFALAKQGHNLLLVDRAITPLRQVTQELSRICRSRIESALVDLSDPQAPLHLLRYCHKNRLRIATLINNAGVGYHGSFPKQRRSSIKQIIDINVIAATELVRVLLPHMLRRQSGTILNVSSISAFEVEPDAAVYGASKAYLASFTESLAAEVSDSGVYVTSLCPGITSTPFLRESGLDADALASQAQTPEQVVEEALRGMEKRKRVIVTGLPNRIRFLAQRTSVRQLIHGSLQVVRRLTGRR